MFNDETPVQPKVPLKFTAEFIEIELWGGGRGGVGGGSRVIWSLITRSLIGVNSFHDIPVHLIYRKLVFVQNGPDMDLKPPLGQS